MNPYFKNEKCAWRRISFYGWVDDTMDFRESIVSHPEVTELKLEIYEATYDWVKDYGMAQLPNLEVLHFVKGSFTVSHTDPDNKAPYRGMDVETDFDNAVYMTEARDFFKLNREFMSASSDICTLQYIGFYTHMYTCSLIHPDIVPPNSKEIFSVKFNGTDGKPDARYYRVRKPSMSEAIMFGDVNSMAFEKRFQVGH